MSTVKALPTTYAGVEFRSRIEARWALFFDKLGVSWSYEREGYELPTGNYLPDFWLPDVRDGCWFEVKGANPTRREYDLAIELAQATDHEVFVAYGDMPRTHQIIDRGTSRDRDQLSNLEIDYFCPEGADVWYSWCVCPCGKPSIEFEARADRICRHDASTMRSSHGDKGNNGAHPRIIAAYEAARTHKFWKPGVT